MRSTIIRIAQALFLAAYALPNILATSSPAIPDEVSALCESPTAISEAWVGENKDVKMTSYSCTNISGNGNSTAEESSLTKRANNVCGAQCVTDCFNPAGGGPDPNECHVISDALRYNSQNIGNVFDIPRSAAVVRMQYASCYSFFVNQATVDLQYCRQDWAAVLDYVAFNCQAQQNAHGGLCLASSKQWFIQVQHS